MPILTKTVVKSPDATNRQYWFLKPDCGDYASVVSFSKTTSNSTMVFNSAVVNSSILTDCNGNSYAVGKAIVVTLSGGENQKNETCKVVYLTTGGEQDSFLFNVKIDERGNL